MLARLRLQLVKMAAPVSQDGGSSSSSTVGVIYLERDKSLERLTLHAYFLH